LLGKYNPAGRLPMSVPRSATRIPCYYTRHPGGTVAYLEGPIASEYPFGFGLSYTSFEYSDLSVRKQDTFRVAVSCKVTNTGGVAGDEVVQLYIDDAESSVVTPPKLLKGFRRIHLKTGETAEVTFHLDYDSFKLMDAHYNMTVEPGLFRILVGAASNDIRLEGEVTI